jgi:hypothetical protein
MGNDTTAQRLIVTAEECGNDSISKEDALER